MRPALKAELVEKILRKGATARAEGDFPAKFTAGDAVLVRNIHPTGHTRVPRYARGRRGVVHLDHGAFTFPDSNAAGDGPNPQHVYSVRFTARELWGPAASPRDTVHLDLWDDYLDPA